MTGKTLLSSIKFSLHLTVGLLTVATLATTGLGSATAQVGQVKPLEDLQTKDSADFFNGRGNGQSGSMMNFIQNAIIGSPRSMDEYTSEQKDNLDSAADQFRKQQAERMRTQPQQPGAPAMTQPGVMAPSN
jgi:hypothetical protein